MNECKDKILQTVLKRPVTMMQLTTSVSCAAETVQKYIQEFEKAGKISSKKSKFKIFYNPKLELKKIEFFKIMLNPTVSSVVKIMLGSSEITQIELSQINQKSLPSISRALSLLVSNNFVKINYYTPGKSWSIIDNDQILSFMRETIQIYMIQIYTNRQEKDFLYSYQFKQGLIV